MIKMYCLSAMRSGLLNSSSLILSVVLTMIAGVLGGARTNMVYRVAFVAGDCHESHLYTIRSDGEDLHSLTDADCAISELSHPVAWSSDGQWIAFTRGGDLYRIRYDGSEEHFVFDNFDLLNFILPSFESEIVPLLTENNPGINPFREVVWSIDGSSLFLRVAEMPWYSGTNINLFQVNVDGTNLHRITDVTGPGIVRNFDLSPDGNWLTYEWIANCRRCNPALEGGDIFIVRPDGSESRNLSLSGNVQAQDTSPVWSADSQEVSYASLLQGQWSLYQVSIENNETQPLAVNVSTHPIGFLRMAEAGLIYAISIEQQDSSRGSFDTRLFLWERGATHSQEMIYMDDVWIQSVTLSPNGQLIVLRKGETSDERAGAIFLMQPDSTLVRLAEDFTLISRPVWSPIPFQV